MSAPNKFQEAIDKLRTHAQVYDKSADGAKYASEAFEAENSAIHFRRAALYLEGLGRQIPSSRLYTCAGCHPYEEAPDIDHCVVCHPDDRI